MNDNFFIYFITDGFYYKIGKTNNPERRKADLQTGNANWLDLVHLIPCHSQGEADKLERELHNKYEEVRIRKDGEWFYPHPDFDSFPKTLREKTKYKEGLDSLDIFGEKRENVNPRCYFYPELNAQIMDNAVKSSRRKIPWRTMKFPTNGKQELLPYSIELDKVFISTKKHKENLALNRFNNANIVVSSNNVLKFV